METVRNIPQAVLRYRESANCALICGEETVRYKELIADAERVASALFVRGIRKGDRVCVDMSRSADYVRVWAGILFAGAVQLTLHEEWPERMKSQAMSDCLPAMTIDDVLARELLDEGVEWPDLKESVNGIAPEDPFQIIYTSGSTGRPKGAVNTHGMALDRALMTGEDEFVKYFCDTCDSFLIDCDLSFVVASQTLLLCLLNEKTAVLADKKEKSSAVSLARCIKKSGVNAAYLTPSYFGRNQKDSDYMEALSGLRLIRMGGELIPHASVSRLIKTMRGKLICTYGSSETLGCPLYSFMDSPDSDAIAYGSLRAPGEVFVLDASGEPSVSGELCIGGVSGAHGGYFGDPQLTSGKFVVHQTYGRLYHTGDLTMRNADGSVLIRGRIDATLNLHGIRLEAGGIEQAMTDYPNVTRAAADVRGEADKAVLMAWYTAEGKVDRSGLRRYLLGRLPYYMVPQLLMELECMPVNERGKLDRKKLPDIRTEVSAYRKAANAKEELLCKAFAEVLGMDHAAGADDDFFQLGGTSLSCMELVSALAREGMHIETRWLFASPTPAQLSPLMEPISDTSGVTSPDVPRLSEAQESAVRNAGLEDRAEHVYPVTKLVRDCIRDRDPWMIIDLWETNEDLPYEVFRERLERMTASHEALRSVFLCPEGEAPIRVVLKRHVPDSFRVDLRTMGTAGERFSERQKRYFSALALLDTAKEAELEKRVLFKAGLLRISEDRSVIYTAFSHLLLDGMGRNRIMNELLGRRPVFEDGEASARREARLARARKEMSQRQKPLPDSNLKATKLPSPGEPAGSGQTRFLHILQGNDMLTRLLAWCRRNQVTLSALVHQVLADVLCEQLGTEECVLVSAASGRTAEEAALVGMFAHPYLLRLRKGQAVRECQDRLMAAQENAWIWDEDGDEHLQKAFEGGVMLDMLDYDTTEHEQYRRLNPIEILEPSTFVRYLGAMSHGDRICPATLLFETLQGRVSLWGRYDSGRCDADFMQRLAKGIREKIVRRI